MEETRQRYGNQPERLEERLKEIRTRYAARLPSVRLGGIADHIDHVVRIARIDHVGLESDFDGINATPDGMEDVSKLPGLVRELASGGYSEYDLKQIVGGNTLRVMRDVEKVARQISLRQGGRL